MDFEKILNDMKTLGTDKYISFSGYETKELPLPIETINNQGWVNWGKNNAYPDYITDLVNRSAIHNAIINLKASMIGKNGFVKDNWSQETIQFLNNGGDPLKEILSKISLDLSIYGGFFLNIIWNRERTRIVKINYILPSTVRIVAKEALSLSYPNNDEYLICPDWNRWRQNIPTLYPGFSTDNRKVASQILLVKEHRSTDNVYPTPEYTAGISLMELNYQINEFHLHTVLNQFAPSMEISIPYVPSSDDEMENIVRRMKKQYEGSKKAGNVAITFNENPDNRIEFKPIMQNDSDKRFKELTTWMRDGIFSAHNINAQGMFGIETAGRLGGRNNSLEDLQVFQSQYVGPKQRIIEDTFNMLARINGVPDKILIEKYDDNLQPDLPMADIISLLQSTMTDKQKVAVLQMKGYNREQAINLVSAGTPPTNNIQ